MKNIIILFLCLGFIFISAESHAQIFSAKDGVISFFSSSPLEDIDAHNKSVNSFINTTKKEVLFIVPVRGFEFKKKLMQEHFNENYMESDKFPSSTYSGKIEGDVDFSKNGSYDVSTKGKLKIHGVEKDVSEKGKITVTDGIINLQTSFSVLLKDYTIEIPKVVYKNIAEKIDIKVNINYVPYKKDK